MTISRARATHRAEQQKYVEKAKMQCSARTHTHHCKSEKKICSVGWLTVLFFIFQFLFYHFCILFVCHLYIKVLFVFLCAAAMARAEVEIFVRVTRVRSH